MSELDSIREKKMEDLKKKLSYPNGSIEVTGANFAENIEKYPLMVVDCWAEWCFPCKVMGPVFDELAREYVGRIVFGKLDIDGNREAAMKFEVQSIPTLLVFKDGKLVDRMIGAIPREQIKGKLENLL